TAQTFQDADARRIAWDLRSRLDQELDGAAEALRKPVTIIFSLHQKPDIRFSVEIQASRTDRPRLPSTGSAETIASRPARTFAFGAPSLSEDDIIVSYRARVGEAASFFSFAPSDRRLRSRARDKEPGSEGVVGTRIYPTSFPVLLGSRQKNYGLGG